VTRTLAALLLAAALATADKLPYDDGLRHNVKLEGLDVAMLVPDDYGKQGPGSMVVLLHGSGDSGGNLIRGFNHWMEAGYLVCAPTATVRRAWSAADVQAVIRIGKHLLDAMPVGPGQVHVVGYSNGGWNLTPLAFSDVLKPVSATYVAAGYRGGSVPKWAKKRLGVLAMAGEQDGNVGAARGTVTALRGKVFTVEVRTEPDLGHRWPRSHDEYQTWWMGAREGRFEPGVDMNFKWGDDIEDAVDTLKDRKKGGVFVYVYDGGAKDDALAKRLQNEIFMDGAVRFFGNQLQAVKLEHSAETEKLGVKAAPAIVVLKKDGSVKKVVAGKTSARSLAAALKSVAPKKRMPK
jgi:predicted esterase